MNNKEMIKQLGLTFLKIGAFTFGGGYAMIPVVQKEMIEDKKWLTNDELMDVVAIAETTPGPIAINTATFVGYKLAGFWGALASTIGVVFPSFAIIILVAIAFSFFKDNQIVQNAFWGIRFGVIALLVRALITMYKQCPKTKFSYIAGAVVFLLAIFTEISIIWVILGAAIVGILWQLFVVSKTEGGD